MTTATLLRPALLRPARQLTSTLTVAAVAMACVVSGPTGAPAVSRPGKLTIVTQEWQSSSRASRTEQWQISAAGATRTSRWQAPVARSRSATVDASVVGSRAADRASGSAQLRLVAASPALRVSTYESRVIRRINAVRHARGLKWLRSAPCAERVAGRWSRWMVSTGRFRHQSMARLLRTCDARYVGETLGRGSIGPRTLVSLWMRSTPHRRILLSAKPRRIGVGARTNRRGQWVVTANFMRL